MCACSSVFPPFLFSRTAHGRTTSVRSAHAPRSSCKRWPATAARRREGSNNRNRKGALRAPLRHAVCLMRRLPSMLLLSSAQLCVPARILRFPRTRRRPASLGAHLYAVVEQVLWRWAPSGSHALGGAGLHLLKLFRLPTLNTICAGFGHSCAGWSGGCRSPRPCVHATSERRRGLMLIVPMLRCSCT